MTATAHALPISGVVIAKDEADRIGRCVASLAEVCSEVLVLDSGSGDATVAVATAAGARVEHQPWLGFSAQKNAAIAHQIAECGRTLRRRLRECLERNDLRFETLERLGEAFFRKERYGSARPGGRLVGGGAGHAVV